MRIVIEVIAGLAILANAAIYGTDVFGALIQRPAMAAVDDHTLIQALGHVHRVADVRLRAITITGLFGAIATTAVAAASTHWVSAAAGGVATLALLTFITIYTQVAKPVNTALTAAAIAGEVPGNTRTLQAQWDSVINGRVALQAIALTALCVGVAAA